MYIYEFESECNSDFGLKGQKNLTTIIMMISKLKIIMFIITIWDESNDHN